MLSPDVISIQQQSVFFLLERRIRRNDLFSCRRVVESVVGLENGLDQDVKDCT